MKFSEKYIKDMKSMKLFSISVIIVGVIAIPLFFSMAINLFLYYLGKNNDIKEYVLMAWIIGIITGPIMIALIRYDYKIKKRKKQPGEPYIFDIDKEISYESLCNTLKSHKYFSNSFNIDDSSIYKTVCKTINKHDVYKYYVFKMEEYNKTEYQKIFKKLNETYKKKYKEKDNFIGWERHARCIFVFVDKWSKDAEHLVHYFQKDLGRVQTSMTYIIYKHKIYISPIFCDFTNEGAYRFINKEAKKILDMVK